MAQTELYDFIVALQALSVPGVARTFPGPPGSITTADMPALWLHAAGVREEPAARGCTGWPTLRAELWLIVGPVSQSTTARSVRNAAKAGDALREALRTADLAAGPATIDVKVTADLTLNEKAYWGAIAIVEAQG